MSLPGTAITMAGHRPTLAQMTVYYHQAEEGAKAALADYTALTAGRDPDKRQKQIAALQYAYFYFNQ